MRPDNSGLKIAFVGWLGVGFAIISIFSTNGDIPALFYLALIPLLLSGLFVFTKRASFAVLYLILLIFGRWPLLMHGVFWKKALLIALIIAFVYGIVLAILVKKPQNK